MTDQELRLECLRLTYTHGRTSAEAVGRAQELEAYVKNMGGQGKAPVVKQKTLTLPAKK